MKTLFIIPLVLMSLVSLPSWGFSMNDSVKREGLSYKKFTGEIGEGWERGNFKHGRKEGKWVSFDSNSQLLDCKGALKNFLREGTWVCYFTNGRLARHGEYKNGSREGPWVYFNFDGSEDTLRSGVYRNGRKVSD